MELVALKTFSRGGVNTVKQGDTFTANDAHAQEYIRLGLAKPTDAKEAAKVEAASAPATDIAKSDYTEEELTQKTITDLKKIAKNIGVTGYSNSTKSELIFAILAKQKSNAEKMEG